MRTSKIAASALLAVAALALTGCSSGAPELAGLWSADDGSGTKIINEDGSCSGMYWNGHDPLDIGGPMTCALGDKETDGHYLLSVQQSPNQATYFATFPGDDTMVISDDNGTIVTLTRQ